MAETKFTFWKTDKRKKRSYKDLKFSLEEIESEFQYLQTLGKIINDLGEKETAVERALKDSFLLHFRKIHNFLYAGEPDEKIIVAEDFFETRDEWYTSRIKESQVMKDSAELANTEILKLSYGKGTDIQDEYFLEVVEEVEKVYSQFVKFTLPGESTPEEQDPFIKTKKAEAVVDEAPTPVGKSYGTEDELYKVNLREDGFLEVIVCHNNQAVRKVISNNLDNPGYFLDHLESYRAHNHSAKKWLAVVVMDYQRYFEEKRVVFTLQ